MGYDQVQRILSSVSTMRVTFQFGMHKESVTLDETSMNGIAEAAAIFVTRCFPEHRLKRIQENVHLLRHNINSSNILEIIRSESDIMEDCLIEIVLSESTPMEDLQISPHVMAVHSYKSPHFCDFCGEMLFGLVRQGLKCEGCGRNFHKRCAFKIPNNCSLSRRLGENNSVAALASLNLPVTSNRSWTGRPVWLEREYAGRVKVPHTFVVHSYTKPTICQYCKKLLHGLFRQGLQCKDCCFNVHRRCAKLVTSDCEGEAFEVSESVYDADYVIAEADVNRTVNNGRNSSDAAVDANEDWTSSGDTDMSEIDSQEVNDDPDNSENAQQKPPLSPSASSNIPLMRVIQSVKHTKGKGSTIIREGWMVHCTRSDPVRRRHFWRLDTKCITLFIDERTNRYFKEFQLSEITALTHSVTERNDQKSHHVFEMHMKSGQLILVGEDPCFGNEDMTNNKIVNSPDSGIGREQARHFELAIRNALMPVTPQVSANENESSKDGQQEGPKSTVTAGRSFKSDKPGSDSMSSGQIADIGQLYEINPDELLGSGQFGVVYGAKSKSGMDVAIKVIDKQRFPTKQEAQLKNEVTILHNLHHPGVIILERMFETDERIYVVMEKMQGDMLEMILNSPRSRLSERVTKFLVTQILVALKYLHSKNVVHCDLKPENVLLSTNSAFPQIKLCDFGFARLIGEKSFRRSIVGTPAYLAPEVLKSKGYNRSIDVWSVGVVVYVSLSGTFPFNEDEEIHDQIQNAAFMYPPNPWKEISVDATNLINSLLQVKLRRRYSLDKCFTHKWLQDYKCWCDLRKLEENLGLRFITYECEDSRWEEHRKNNNLPSWKELGWNSSN